MARLYANENFPLPVVEALRRTGHDVMTVRESGKADQAVPDEEIPDLAAGEDRAVLTLNRKHFVRLHKERPNTRASSYAPSIRTSSGRLIESTTRWKRSPLSRAVSPA